MRSPASARRASGALSAIRRCPTALGPKPSQGKTATASSGDAAQAVDGNLDSRWESVHGVDPQWFQVDLGSVQSIDRIALDWEAARASNYTVAKLITHAMILGSISTSAAHCAASPWSARCGTRISRTSSVMTMTATSAGLAFALSVTRTSGAGASPAGATATATERGAATSAGAGGGDCGGEIESMEPVRATAVPEVD